MDPISIFLAVFTLQRVFNSLLFGIILGRVFNPTNTEIYKLAIYLLIFIMVGFSINLVQGNENLVIQGIATIALGVISNIGLILGRLSNEITFRGPHVLERKARK